jgi:hypothetical protein
MKYDALAILNLCRSVARPASRQRSAWAAVGWLLLWTMFTHAGSALAATPLPAATQSALDRRLLSQAADASAVDIRRLIQNGAHVNAQDRFGVTPLMQAVIGNNVVAVQMLIAAHADLNLRNIRGDTALDFAQELGRADIERLLTAMP